MQGFKKWLVSPKDEAVEFSHPYYNRVNGDNNGMKDMKGRHKRHG